MTNPPDLTRLEELTKEILEATSNFPITFKWSEEYHTIYCNVLQRCVRYSEKGMMKVRRIVVI